MFTKAFKPGDIIRYARTTRDEPIAAEVIGLRMAYSSGNGRSYPVADLLTAKGTTVSAYLHDLARWNPDTLSHIKL
jgi:hypothetical protein